MDKLPARQVYPHMINTALMTRPEKYKVAFPQFLNSYGLSPPREVL